MSYDQEPTPIEGTFTPPPEGLRVHHVSPQAIKRGDYMIDTKATTAPDGELKFESVIYWQALADATNVLPAVGWSFTTFPVAFVDGVRAWLQYGSLATLTIDVLREDQ